MTLASMPLPDLSGLQNPDAELTALGEVIADGGKSIHRLSADMFDTLDGVTLWSSLERMAEAGTPICETTAAKCCPDIEIVGRALNLTGAPGLDYSLSQLRESRSARLAYRAATEYADKFLSLGSRSHREPVRAELQTSLSALSGQIATAAAGLNEASRVSQADLVAEMLEEMDRADRGERPNLVPTGMSRLDAMLGGGMKPGHMVVIAARTGVGKTALALHFCRHALNGGRSVLYANREMVPGDMRDRLLSAEAGFSFRASDGARKHERHAKALTVAAARFKGWPLNIRSNLRTIPGVLGEAKMTRPDLVVIDHVSAFNDATGKKSATQYDVVTHNSNAARDMAIDLKIPVLVVSQINRAGGEAEEPRLHHLKQSGAIEEDARVVMLLHCVDTSDPRRRQMNLAIAKQNNGPTGHIDLTFNPECQRFEETGPEIQPEDCNP